MASPYPAAAQWGLMLSIPAMTSIFKEPIINLMLTTVVFPLALSFLSRSGTFFVSTQVILLASVATFFFSYLLSVSFKNIQQILKEPGKKRVDTALLYGGIIVMFMLFMIGSKAAGVDLYNAPAQMMNATAAAVSNTPEF